MALPSTGSNSMDQVRTELGRTGTISLNDGTVRALAGKPSGAISMADPRGKSADEMRARNPVPVSCTPAQGLIALYALKNITEQDILDAINLIPDPVERYTAQTGYSRATSWERESPTMQTMAGLLGLSEQDLDDLYVYAVGVMV